MMLLASTLYNYRHGDRSSLTCCAHVIETINNSVWHLSCRSTLHLLLLMVSYGLLILKIKVSIHSELLSRLRHSVIYCDSLWVKLLSVLSPLFPLVPQNYQIPKTFGIIPFWVGQTTPTPDSNSKRGLGQTPYLGIKVGGLVGFLRFTISQDLKWHLNVNTIIKKSPAEDVAQEVQSADPFQSAIIKPGPCTSITVSFVP